MIMLFIRLFDWTRLAPANDRVFNVLNYYSNVETVLFLKHQWHISGRMPARLFAFYFFIVMFWCYLLVLLFFVIVPSIDPITQLIMGNISMMLGLPTKFNLAIFVICMPIPYYYLLIYPYLSTNHVHHLCFPLERINHQLSLPAQQQEPGFRMYYQTFQIFLFMFFILLSEHVYLLSFPCYSNLFSF